MSNLPNSGDELQLELKFAAEKTGRDLESGRDLDSGIACLESSDLASARCNLPISCVSVGDFDFDNFTSGNALFQLEYGETFINALRFRKQTELEMASTWSGVGLDDDWKIVKDWHSFQRNQKNCN